VSAERLAALGEAAAQLPHEMRMRFFYDVSVPSALGERVAVYPDRSRTAASGANGCANQPHVLGGAR
jgi:hypothetical protein